MTVHDVIAFLLRRRLTLIGTFGMIVVLVTLFAYALPPGFQSTASVLVERTQPTATPLTYAPNQEMVEILNTEAAIITSRPVLEQVIDELGLANRVSQPKGLGKVLSDLRQTFVNIGLTTNAPPRERWVSRLERQVQVNPGIQSSVLTISFSSEDPAQARLIVDGVTSAYLTRRQEIFADQGLSAFYAARLSEVEVTLETLRGELAESRGTSDEGNVAAESLRTQLARLRSELAVREADLQVASSRFLPGHTEVRSARAQVAFLREAVADAEEQLLQTAKVLPDVEQLTIEIANEEASLRTLKAQFEAAVINERSQSSFLDVRLVSPANLPAKPTVSRLLIIFLGVTSGIALAVMFAIVVEYFDERTHNADEIEDILKLPCIGTLPQKMAIASAFPDPHQWQDGPRRPVPDQTSTDTHPQRRAGDNPFNQKQQQS